MTDTDHGAELSPAALAMLDELEREADELAGAITATLQREIAAYAELPYELIRDGVRADMVASIAGQRSSRMPTEPELMVAEQVGGERAAQGLPIEALLQAFRIGVREVVARAREHAPRLTVGDNAMLELIEQSWRWTDAVSVRAAQGHRATELTRLRADVHRRAAFLHSALHGELPLSELHAQAAAIGLDPAGRYAAVRARASDRLPPHRLQAILAEAAGTARELIGIVDGDVAGIVRDAPHLPATTVCGLGPTTQLERIAISYKGASEALTAAVAFARTGVHTLEELALETAVLDERIGVALERRCLAPLEPLGANGRAILDTIQAFLDSGMRYEQAAAALSIHPNTLRHRLGRYHELTGLDLRDVRDLVATWIALQQHRILAKPPGDAASARRPAERTASRGARARSRSDR